MSGTRQALPSIAAWNQESGNAELASVTVLQAARRFCWNCMGGHEFPITFADGTTEARYRPTADVRDCASRHCWLYIYRMGRNPSRAGVGSLRNVSETPTQPAKSRARTRSEGQRRSGALDER
jgi:hypothetical protein